MSWVLALLVIGGLAGLSACPMDNPEFKSELGGEHTQAERPGDGDEDDPPATTDEDDEPDTDSNEDDEPTTEGDGDCPAGQTLCADICTDTDFDKSNCGGCGNGCPEAQLCGLGSCQPKKYIFVSTAPVSGGFGGSESPDKFCGKQAMDAFLPGQFKAWVTTGSTPLDFSPGGAYMLRNGDVVAWSWQDLIDGELESPINRDQLGDLINPASACDIEFAVWTGTTHAGLPLPDNCEAWTSSLFGPSGAVGDAQAIDQSWSATECLADCFVPLPIYCVQQ